MAESKAEEGRKGITARKSENFSEWYTQVIEKTEFVDYTPVSGGLAFRPDGYFVWETVQRATDALFKKAGILNVYFPMLIPEHLLEKEKEHVRGFAPEVAWVTHAGKSKLEERLAVRPTSETIMYESFAKWIRSWRDLPLRTNQWNSVIRWEFKHPTPLLRSREFMWNEGHTVFATREEAEAERDQILGIYEKVLKEYMALPGIAGRKTDSEKFAGAEASYSIEHLIPDGWAIQGPDFHSDGQNFSKAFGIEFINKEGKKEFAYQNTFALTTRELGVMIAVHGDDRGLVIPPRVARIQAVIVPIYTGENRELVLRAAKSLAETLSRSVRVHLDDRDAYSPGWKFHNWELMGVPLRIEIGERDIKAERVVAVRRDTLEKREVKLKDVAEGVGALLDEIHENLYRRAKRFMEENTHEVKTYAELKKVVEGRSGGIAHAGWCGSAECEAKAKEEAGAKITNMPFDAQGRARGRKCVVCGASAKFIANFARSY
jgi:prolyl-tRNA synthetase